MRAWPAKTVNTLAPSAAIRSSTAFCAPLPSATIVMTAPTPMMMPSMVSIERSLLARMDWKRDRDRLADQHGSARSAAARARAGRRVRSAAACPGSPPPPVIAVHPLARLLLRLHQARARQDQHRVGRPRGRSTTSL